MSLPMRRVRYKETDFMSLSTIILNMKFASNMGVC